MNRVIAVESSRIPNIPEKLQQNGSVTYQICQPVLLVGKLFGFVSWKVNRLTIHSPELNNICGTVMCWMYRLIFPLFLIYWITILVQNLQLTNVSSKTMDDIIRSIVYLVLGLFSLSVFIACFLNDKRFCYLLLMLGKVDNLLCTRIDKAKFFLKSLFIQIALTLPCPILFLIYVFINVHGIEKLKSIAYIVVIFAAEFFSISFTDIVMKLCAECFSALNNELRIILSMPTPLTQMLNTIQVSYEQLHVLAAAIQDTVRLLVTVNVTFLGVLLCLNIYAVVFSKWDSMVLIGHGAGVIWATAKIFSLANEADNLANQASAGCQWLTDVKNNYLSHREEFQITILLSKLGRPIEITSAFGLFTINRKTFSTIISTIITYVIVLTQMRPNGSKNVSGFNATELINSHYTK